MEKDLKFKDIVNKLKELSCPLVNNGNDVWLQNVILKPGFERYSLIEWLLKKFELNTGEYENQNSLEEKTQSLLDICSGYGFCSEKDSSIIEGTASVKKQVIFWDLLSNSQYKRNPLSNFSIQSENSDLRHEKYNSEQYEHLCTYVSKVCESINLSHIFKSELQLFPVYLTKEVKSTIQGSGNLAFSADIIKKLIYEKCGLKAADSSFENGNGFENKSLEINEIEVIPYEKTVIDLEEDISKSLCHLQSLQVDSFSKAHNSLSLYFPKETSNDFTDIGPAFKLINEKLTSVLKLKTSATSLNCCDLELNNLNSEVTSFEIPPEILSDSKLEEYTRILSEIQNKE